jgi:hypothetical protein
MRPGDKVVVSLFLYQERGSAMRLSVDVEYPEVKLIFEEHVN